MNRTPGTADGVVDARPARWRSSRPLWRVLGPVCFWVALLSWFVAEAWRAGTWQDWWRAYLFVLLAELVWESTARWVAGPRLRAAVRVLVVLATASLVVPDSSAGSWWALAAPVLLWAMVACVAVFVAVLPQAPGTRPLRLPVVEGRWVVAPGGHWPPLPSPRRDRARSGALELVRLAANGSRATSLLPRDLTHYAAYDTPVLAPCDGVVVEAVDGLPDQDVDRPQTQPALGNHVRIDTGTEHVVLAHLRPGSVTVTSGERVSPGQLLGRIGNSGRSTEPHLHLHAERDGLPVALAFGGIRGRLHWGRVFDVGGTPPGRWQLPRPIHRPARSRKGPRVEHPVFAALYERGARRLEDSPVGTARRELVPAARGVTVDLGAGVGLNLPHLGPAVTELHALEPDPAMVRRLFPRLPEGAYLWQQRAEELPFDDASIDTVLVTLTLCTVTDVAAAVAELGRVLAPGGQLLVLEHVASTEPRTATWQRWLRRPWGWACGGCDPTRDLTAALAAGGFDTSTLRRFPITELPVTRDWITGPVRRR